MGQQKNIEILKAIAIHLKELRETNNLTQKAFYKGTNIHIARIETGKYNVSISPLDAICN